MTVVVINHNTREQLRSCLASLLPAAMPATRGQCDPVLSVMVVDNASTDGSVEMVRHCYPMVNIQANRENTGYGCAANQAILTLQSDYVLLLNSDTFVSPQAVYQLSSYLDKHPQVAVAGPRLLNVDGSLQPSCYPFPTPLHLFLQETRLEHLLQYIPVARNRTLRIWAHDAVRRVPWVLGAALALRRSAFTDVGGFDEEFFMYAEEVDLCLRLGAAGWQVHFVPEPTITHVGGSSTKLYGDEMQWYFYQSMQSFYRKHYSPWAQYQLRLMMRSIALLRLIRGEIRRIGFRRPASSVWRRIVSDDRTPRKDVPWG